jgi:hypothetical protein
MRQRVTAENKRQIEKVCALIAERCVSLAQVEQSLLLFDQALQMAGLGAAEHKSKGGKR